MWDFNEIGIDVIDFFTGDRGWREFYAYMNELPPHSKFRSAISQDPDLAKSQVDSLSDDDIREIMEKDDKDGDKTITPEGYDMQIEKLNQVIEEVRLLRLGMTGDKKTKFTPPIRPSTEADSLIKERIEALEQIDRDTFEKELGF